MNAETGRRGDTEIGEGSLFSSQPSAVDRSAEFSESSRRRVSASVLRWLVHISRFGLAALFLFTAGAKLAIIKTFSANVAELLSASGINYAGWMWSATIAVIGVGMLRA